MDNRQVRLARTPQGVPREEDFEVTVAETPKPGAGQVLCRTRYLSLDPYMRSQIAGRHLSGSIGPGDLMNGETVSEVLDSRAPGFERGQLVRGRGGWQEYSLHEGEDLALVPPDIEPPSYALSLLGMTGLTAWAGVTWQARVGEGERVLIPAVTGGVGAAAAQFCRLAGATVIGIAGGPQKCRYAEKALGVEACIDRHGDDVSARLDALFPEGIDFYFDLVGGDLLAQASARLALNARVVLAGLISEYNEQGRAPGPPPGDWIRARATVFGLVVYDFEPRRDEFIAACLPHVKAGRLQQREDVSQGIEAAPAAFCRLMRGENFGKVIVAL